MVDLGGSVQFPVMQNDSIISIITMGDYGEATQQGALWWDGGDYIYK